jgi:hypothetical protein
VFLTDIIARNTVDELHVLPVLANKEALKAAIFGGGRRQHLHGAASEPASAQACRPRLPHAGRARRVGHRGTDLQRRAGRSRRQPAGSDPVTDEQNDLQTAILAGLDQAREAVLGGQGGTTQAWQFVPYSRLRDIAGLVVEMSEMLTTHELLVLGAYLAASSRTQLLART